MTLDDNERLKRSLPLAVIKYFYGARHKKISFNEDIDPYASL